jgi:8-oxo-dGTP pyrophosphatase MutT (NUDIX family)
MRSFDAGPHRFNLRAAAIVVHDEAVLLHRLAGDAYWALPGGRVEAGESAADAVVRELREELSEPVDCGELLWVVENFFSHADRQYHEVGLYFLVGLRPSSRLLASSGPFHGSEGERPLEFAWFSRKRLGRVAVRPSFLVSSLARERLQFQHVVHHDSRAA